MHQRDAEAGRASARPHKASTLTARISYRRAAGAERGRSDCCAPGLVVAGCGAGCSYRRSRMASGVPGSCSDLRASGSTPSRLPAARWPDTDNRCGISAEVQRRGAAVSRSSSTSVAWRTVGPGSFCDMRVPPAKVSFSAEDRADILSKIDDCLVTGQLTLGRLGSDLEEAFAARHGSRFGVAVGSGTSALQIALLAVGVAGREVLVPANTFFATGAAVLGAGGQLRFVECDPDTMALDPGAVAEAIGPRTGALVVVHIGGAITPAMDELQALCAGYQVPLLEDAAHAHGSSFDGRSAGTFGQAGAFSFYPTKVMAGGEGGMLLTDDEGLAAEARIYRDQGKASFLTNMHTRLGSNWRMSEPHAAIAMSQLGHLDEFIARRQELAAIYDAHLPAIGVRPLKVASLASCNYYKYVAFLPEGVDRPTVKRALRDDYGVGLSGEVYDTGLHQQPVFAPWATGPLPRTEWLCARHICLPLYPSLPDEDVRYVVESLDAVLATTSA